MLEVGALAGGVDAHHRVEDGLLAIGGDCGDLDGLRGHVVVERRDALEGEGLLTGETERIGVLPGGELQREDAHADEVGAVDPLVALGDDDLDAQQRGALGGPVTR